METQENTTAPENRNAWLNRHARNVSSQYGEDGIIEKALSLLPAADKWCVEFGAHDGRTYSNSANLIATQNYAAVLIEPNARRFAALVSRHAENSRVICLQKMVGFGDGDNLDAILDPTGIPVDFDLLSIDIDGNDYHAWAAVQRYQPKIVVIEFNPSIPTEIDFVQPCDPKVKHGGSISSICKLAASKGYELICVTQINAIFVKALYFPAFGIADNSAAALRVDTSKITHFFQGYDGTFFLRGNRDMIWHGVPMTERRIKQLPFFFCGFPEDFGPIRMFALRVYRRIRTMLTNHRAS